MAVPIRVVFHFYKSGHVATELSQLPETDRVFSEVLFFCFLVSRTLLKIKEKCKDFQQIIRRLDSFRGIAMGISEGSTDGETVKRMVASNPWHANFNGVPGTSQLDFTLTIHQPQGTNCSLSVQEKGWFGLFGAGKHLAYGSAMVALWSFLTQRRITQLSYIGTLSWAGFLVGKAFLDQELMSQTETKVIEKVIQTLIALQKPGIDLPDSVSQYAVNVCGLIDVASRGNVQAQGFLGMSYEHGIAMLVDHEEAVRWYQAAADSGNPQGQFHLGCMYFDGLGVTQNFTVAAKWFESAALSGHARAEARLGLMYERGLGVPHDFTCSFQWLAKAAEKGAEEAIFHLGYLYFEGIGLSQDYQQAFKHFWRVAESGSPVAQAYLGLMYQDGLGVGQDYQKAAEWYLRSAEQGEARGQYGLGYLMVNGLGVPTDFHEGLEWLIKAASLGHPQAQHAVGKLYDNTGRQEDAVVWYRRAAENGHKQAKRRLKELQ